MPPATIRVRPAPALRREFAAWAVEQTPKVRTVSPNEFAVPVALFTAVPEPVLIGALVDGHRYISPDEDAENGTPPPGEVLGVATAAAFTAAGTDTAEALGGGVAAAEGGGGSGLDFAPLDDAPADPDPDPGGEDGTPGAPGGKPYPCDRCPRAFTTERGLATHRAMVHGR